MHKATEVIPTGSRGVRSGLTQHAVPLRGGVGVLGQARGRVPALRALARCLHTLSIGGQVGSQHNPMFLRHTHTHCYDSLLDPSLVNRADVKTTVDQEVTGFYSPPRRRGDKGPA